jgi:hypothetical protein
MPEFRHYRSIKINEEVHSTSIPKTPKNNFSLKFLGYLRTTGTKSEKTDSFAFKFRH